MNPYRKSWEACEDPKTQPLYARKLVEMDYAEFAAKVREEEPGFVREIVESLYSGDIYLLKNGFPKKFMQDLLDETDVIWKQTPSSFHKMLEGCPNFHRIQDEETAKNYVFQSVRHSYYWFHWNPDPFSFDSIAPIMERWRIFKYVGGYRYDEYEKNTPKDGIVDRFQVARYLPGGRSETHSDPYQNQRTFISAYMSKRGVDYDTGGFYVVGPGNKKIDVEDRIDVGDIGIGYATVMHGVAEIDSGRTQDWNQKNGRWWLGLYSNSTDYVKDRATGVAKRIELTP